MTLPSSGAISLNQVNVEWGLAGGAAITMNDLAVRSLAEIYIGPISFNNLYGKTAFPTTYVSNSGFTTGNGTSWSQSVPNGNIGDLLLLYVNTIGSRSRITQPVGWTRLADTSYVSFAYKFATATSESSFTITGNTSGTTPSIVLRYRNAGTPIIGATAPSNYLSTNPISMTAAAVPSASSLSTSLAFFAPRGSSATFTTPIGYTSIISDIDATAPSAAIFSKYGGSTVATSTVTRTAGGIGDAVQILIPETPRRPGVSGIDRSILSTGGGTPVTITGAFFVNVSSVTIGGTAVSSFTVVSSTTITAISAARLAGTNLSVNVTTPLGTSSSNTLATYAVLPESIYSTPGTYSWTAPAGVTSVCVVCVGGGGGYSAGGGGLGWKNNIAVTPGSNYTVVVGAGGQASGTAGGQSYFINTSTVVGNGGAGSFGNGGTFVGDGGGRGGNGAAFGAGGGGGAGGYSGQGGDAYDGNSAGGGGGGGYGGGGGGVGVHGQGTTGINNLNGPGGGGSGGGAGGQAVGGLFGGGAGLDLAAGRGGNGAVRIIWGAGKSFPSNAA